VFDESHGDGVEHDRFLRRWHSFHQLQKRHVAERDLAENVAAQI
jgi:hypothetical protein